MTPSPPNVADAMLLDDSPFREVRLGLIVASGFFVVFLGWAAFARLDAAASMTGQVAVAGLRQTLQYQAGGAVSQIHVKEGQHVRAGDVLIEFSAPEMQATESSLMAQALALEAERARLEAERDGSSVVTAPAEWTSLTPDEKQLAQTALADQQRQLAARNASVVTQKSVLRQRQAQLAEQIKGYGDQVAASERQGKLLQDQLDGAQRLARRGFASDNTVRALQRSAADINGSRGQYAANVAASKQQIGETEFQIVQVTRQRMEDVATQYQQVALQLNDVLPKLQAAKDAMARATIRAPVSGSVVGLNVFSVGAVLSAGQKLMDIVPDQAPLVISAEVHPADAQDLSVGQEAEVKFESFHQRDLPIFKGKITEVSADSFLDDKTGNRFYTAEVSIPVEELNRLKRDPGQKQTLRPGLPVMVLVPLRKRTALQYLLEPLSEAIWRSFREH